MIRKASRAIALTLASAFAASLATPAQAIDLPVQGSGRGGPFRIACPGGSFMTGFEGRTGAWIDNFRIVCASFDASTRQLSNPRAVPDDRRIGRRRPIVGGVSFGMGDQRNPLSGNQRRRAEQCWAFDRLYVRGDGRHRESGSPFRTAVDARRAQQAFVHSARRLEAQAPEPSDCPGGEFAIGLHGASGKFVDAIGLICVPLPAAPTPQAARPRRRGPQALASDRYRSGEKAPQATPPPRPGRALTRKASPVLGIRRPTRIGRTRSPSFRTAAR